MSRKRKNFRHLIIPLTLGAKKKGKSRNFESRIDCFPPRLETDIILALNFPRSKCEKQSITQKRRKFLTQIFFCIFFAFRYWCER